MVIASHRDGRRTAPTPLLDPAILRRAVVDSFRKLDPRVEAHNPIMFVVLIGVVILVGALTYVPALALGPVVEHLYLIAAK